MATTIVRKRIRQTVLALILCTTSIITYGSVEIAKSYVDLKNNPSTITLAFYVAKYHNHTSSKKSYAAKSKSVKHNASSKKPKSVTKTKSSGKKSAVKSKAKSGKSIKKNKKAVESSAPKGSYKNTFIFSPRTLRWHAYDSSGKIIRSGRASGGKHYCPDIKRSCRTPSGHYRVISKGGPGCRSTRYPLPRGGAPMPYCMFFSRLYAVHGSYDVPGYNASHGCVRVTPGDARWLSQNFMRIGTRVIVLSY